MTTVRPHGLEILGPKLNHRRTDRQVSACVANDVISARGCISRRTVRYQPERMVPAVCPEGTALNGRPDHMA